MPDARPVPPPSAPFVQGRFRDLPEEPYRRHVYSETEALEIELVAPGWPGMAVHVRRRGDGPPLLLIHGLMTSGYSWRYALEPLGERFTCFVPDLPGAGRSASPLAPAYSPSALAAWIGALQRALGIRGCPVLGNSMGGYLALHLALDDPGSMSRLVDLHSPGVPELRLSALGAALAVPGVRALLGRIIRRRPYRWAHRHVHYYDETYKSLEEAREYGQPLASPEGSACLVKYLAETMAVGPMRAFQRRLLDRRAAGQPFPVPLLLVYAERDPMVPPRFGDVLADRIPGSRLVRLAEASHFAHVDATDRFVPIALDFLCAE